MSKTWQESEIQQIIADEARSFIRECVEKGVVIDYAELAECIYATLDDRGLIERSP